MSSHEGRPGNTGQERRAGELIVATTRSSSIDTLRGVVMVLMALDHTRDFFTGGDVDPTDLSKVSAALFLTRFITHYCAPVFVFLAGTAAYMSRANGRSAAQLSRFLFTRGLWLIFVELTIVRFCWLFDLTYHFSVLQVIWAIGWSMVVLAGLVRLRTRTVAIFGGVMVLGHNLLDGIHARALGHWGFAWSVLHEQQWNYELAPGYRLAIIYPLVPWIGVMALGYALGAVMVLPEDRRKRILLRVGLGAIIAFVLVRLSNLYGDPHPWTTQKSALYTFLSFLNCEKYPPSLCYLLMTLGPALVALVLFEHAKGPVARFFIVFGRVPLFYYVLHLLVIHAVSAGWMRARFGHFPAQEEHLALGLSLPGVYLVWACVVLALYPLCRWFAGVKSRNKSAWLSYL